jgi:tetratricopeptide (TPR) repeat protein
MVQKSIDLAKQKGQPGQEAWHRLKLAIFVDKENFKSAEPVAETLVELSPTVRNLTQLGSIYGMNEKSEKQLAILDALFAGGELTQERQFLNLAYLYAGADAPYLASKVLQKGLDSNLVPRSAKNVETLAVTLTQAKELQKALPIMNEAAQKMDNGKNFATLAAIYLDMEKYTESIEAARKAIQKGGLKSKAEVQMYLGSAYLGLKKYDEALNALSGAEGDAKYGTHALNLAKYIRVEKDRISKLNAAQKAPAPKAEEAPAPKTDAPVEEPAKG